jgi:hypothetical protein
MPALLALGDILLLGIGFGENTLTNRLMHSEVPRGVDFVDAVCG